MATKLLQLATYTDFSPCYSGKCWVMCLHFQLKFTEISFLQAAAILTLILLELLQLTLRLHCHFQIQL